MELMKYDLCGAWELYCMLFLRECSLSGSQVPINLYAFASFSIKTLQHFNLLVGLR
jgi:hypothetical protein